MTPFGESLEILRSSRNLTQVQLATKAGITSNYLSMLERGVKGPPAAKTLDSIIDVLGLDEEEKKSLLYDAQLAQFTLRIPPSASRDEYEMVCKLQKHLGTLTSKQVQLIELAMTITGSIRRLVGDTKMKT